MRKTAISFLLFIALGTPSIVAQTTDPLQTVVDYLIRDDAEMHRAIMQGVENTRTDRQIGAAPLSPGSTSLTEKAVVADLLSMAIERGAISNTSDGNSATLSATPYMWLTSFGKDDTPANWTNYAWARRIGIASTFASKDVAKGDFSSFASGELKWTLLGGRSGRDVSRGTLRAGVAEVITAMRAADKNAFTGCTTPMGNALAQHGLLDSVFGALKAGSEKEQFAALDKVFGPSPPQDVREIAGRCAVLLRLQAQTRESASSELDKAVNKGIQSLNAHLLSVAALYQRDSTLSDYYTAKVLYDFKMPSSTHFEHFNLNGAANVNVNRTARDGTTKLHQIRDWSVEAALNSPKIANGRADWNLSTKGVRAKAAGAKTVALAQVKLNLHITAAATLPIAISWANRETDTVKKGVQFNFGFQALLDQFLSGSGR